MTVYRIVLPALAAVLLVAVAPQANGAGGPGRGKRLRDA